ncbi:hypothetical protein GGI42DRAFT_352981 [Trichoderma sp. SZMC 28013]
MADHQSHEEVPEDLKNPFDYLNAESQNLVKSVQRRNLNFLQNDPSINIANGMHIYYDGRGRILPAGAESLAEEYSKESHLDIIWGPGGEASVAKRLIERGPKFKHTAWITSHKVLSEIPANPALTPAVIALLRSTIAKERESWKQLDALKTVTTYSSLFALDMETIIISMCSLAGITLVREGSLLAATAQGELTDLCSNLVWLRHYHQSEKRNRESHIHLLVPHSRHGGPITVDHFKEKWTPILEQLLFGRLANKMEKYVDKMQYLLDNDERYSPK